MMKKEARKLLKTKEAAAQWNISPKAIYRLVKEGKLRPITGFKSWMFEPDDIFEKLERL